MQVVVSPEVRSTGEQTPAGFAARLAPRRRNLIPFLIGVFAAPCFIVLHEGAHWVVARSFGISAKLHYGVTTVHYDRLPPPPSDAFVVAAGPFAQALLAGGGVFWLYRLRRARRLEAATCADWLATWLAFNGARWLAVSAVVSGTTLGDEVALMRACGVPVWLGMALLALTAIALVLATLRFHPPGGRLVPFIYAGLGGVAGMLLWMRWLGPLLLP